MARGHQKIQSQQKAQEAAAKRKKAEGHSAKDQAKAASAALKTKCSVCMVSENYLYIDLESIILLFFIVQSNKTLISIFSFLGPNARS